MPPHHLPLGDGEGRLTGGEELLMMTPYQLTQPLVEHSASLDQSGGGQGGEGGGGGPPSRYSSQVRLYSQLVHVSHLDLVVGQGSWPHRLDLAEVLLTKLPATEETAKVRPP